VHPSGKFFYTVNNGSNNVSANALSATGLATAVTGSPFPLSPASGPTAVAVSPNGLFLFVANRTSSKVSVLSITQTTGALTEISNSPFPLAPAAGPTAITVHPSGNLLFVTNNNPGTLFVFTIQSTGDLTPIGSPVQLLLNPQALALNATGTVVYVANKGSDRILAFLVNQNTGDLTQIASPFDTGANTAPSSVAVGPGDRFLYVANSGGGGTGTIGLFPINPVTGALILPGTILPIIPTGAHPQFITIDPTGRTLYATDSTSNLVYFFSIDPVTGLLTPAGTRAMRAGPGAVAFVSGTAPVTPTPTFAYVANAGAATVSAFEITPATGFLTELVGVGSPFPLTPGTNPQSVAADPFGRYLYVANQVGNNVSAFSIDSGTGSLIAVTGPPPSPFSTGAGPRAVTVEASGRFAYVANAGDNTVSAFAITPATGLLTELVGVGSPFPLTPGTNPQSVAADPLGRYLYVANQGSDNVSAFSIDSGTGSLIAVTGPPSSPFPTGLGTGPRAIVAEPTGRFLYVANTGTDTVSAYLIDAATGSLTGIGLPFSVALGTGPVSLSADPLGRFLYVANKTSNNVSAFAINPTSGALETPSLASATSPQSIAVDLSGRFVYVANGSPNNKVSAFAIDQTTGSLSSVSGSPFAAGLNPSAITTVGHF
jgi:6-phosphogluconolactonase (cycloisomerase 2 family)